MANGNTFVKALNILSAFLSVLFLNPLHDAGMPVTHDKKVYIQNSKIKIAILQENMNSKEGRQSHKMFTSLKE